MTQPLAIRDWPPDKPLPIRFCPVCGGPRIIGDRLGGYTRFDRLRCHHSVTCALRAGEDQTQAADYSRPDGCRPMTPTEVTIATAWGFTQAEGYDKGKPPTTANRTLVIWDGNGAVRCRTFPELQEPTT